MDNPGRYNPNASHKQEDYKRYVLRHRHEPGRGPHPSAARDDPCLPETNATHQREECASRSLTREEDANPSDENDAE
jgi:hypothetical protein